MFTNPTRPSSPQHNFARVPSVDIPRSKFNRSSGYKTTFDAGYLIPFYRDEVLPGDTHSVKLNSFLRMAPTIVPPMDNLYFDTFFFFVPNRLIWDKWQRFMGERPNPGDTVDFLVPRMEAPETTGYEYGSISDYLGIPTGIDNFDHISLYHRAYNLIWNEWFRDENVQTRAVVDIDDGPDDPADYFVRRRGKRHDYFTSCLPFAQKGPAVDLPLSGNAPVYGIGLVGTTGTVTADRAVRDSTDVEATTIYPWSISTTDTATRDALNIAVTGNSTTTAFPNIYANLAEVSAATINDLRLAFQLQRMFERDARGGTRYIELLQSHFGVVSPDARLQRPEYLGGGSTQVFTTPVAQTIQLIGDEGEDIGRPLGSLAGVTTARPMGHGFTKSFVEHGIILGLMMVRADLTYQQGLDVAFDRTTRYTYFWPSLQHLGEQAVKTKEIYLQGDAGDDVIFGYQERYAEYRYKPSLITGKFRSNDPQSLDIWHYAQEFEAAPTLTDGFIEENPPIDRVITVPTEPQFLFDAYIEVNSVRPMSTYSVPGLIDHF